MSSKCSLRISVMLGGPSAEREVSLRSGAAVVKALRRCGHTVSEIDPITPGWKLPEGTQVVFLALHGTYGEDGTVQTELDKLNIPYTGCSAEASRVAFDKVLTKLKCIGLGIPTSKFETFRLATDLFPANWNFPVILKPIRQGSSVGLQFVDRIEQWSVSLKASLEHDTEVLMEERIIGRETTVGILDGEALPIVEVRPKQGCYDYQTKYTSGASEYLCPAPFDDATTARIKQAALGAFHAVGGRDYARVDVMVSPNGDPVVLEVNTLPGMTETSLLPKAAAAVGISFDDLCDRMVQLAMRRAPAS